MATNFSKTFDSAFAYVPGGYVLQKDGVFIPAAEAEKAREDRKLHALFEQQKAAGETYDWIEARDRGFLKKVYKEESEKTSPPVPEEVENSSEIEDVKKEFILPVEKVIKIVLYLVSFGFMFVSWYITHKVQVGNINSVAGTVFACTITTLQAVALAAVGRMWKGGKKVYAGILFFLFCVVEVYSMSNTLKVFYESYMSREYSVNTINAVSSSESSMLGILKDAVESKKNSVADIEKSIALYRSKEWGVKDLLSKKEAAEKEYNSAVSAYSEYQNKHPTALVESQEGKKDKGESTFEEVIGKLLSLSGGTVSIIMACFPALFIDLLAPISLSVAINGFGKEEKKDEER